MIFQTISIYHTNFAHFIALKAKTVLKRVYYLFLHIFFKGRTSFLDIFSDIIRANDIIFIIAELKGQQTFRK